VKLLLDTHALLWWLSAPRSLSKAARAAIASAENLVYLSAAVVWEIRIKEGLGKLTAPRSFERVLAAERFEPLAITVDHAHRLRELPSVHRDPFDRILIAQATAEGATVVTRDAVFDDYEVAVLRA
jgi:PIN domain nuclease of toxin-antitoxin system